MVLFLLAGAAAAQAPAPPQADLVLWLRADAGVERQGERVSAWKDQSGRGNDALSRPGSEPLWTPDGINGRPAVRFDGARSFLVVAHKDELNAGAGFSVLCVLKFSKGFRVAQKKDKSGGIDEDAWFVTPEQGLGVSGRFANVHYFRPRRAVLQASVYSPADRTICAFANGEPAGTLRDVPPQAANDHPVFLGKRNHPGGTEGHLAGEVAELLIYRAALTDDARRQAEAYLRGKYGLAAPASGGLVITRVIPGRHQATLEWLRPPTPLSDADLRYRIAVKLRTAPWAEAATTIAPGDHTRATVQGLLNNADYAVRVTAEQAGAAKPIATSLERLFTPGDVPGTVISYLHRDDEAYARKGQYIGSPSIARMDDGRLAASHDLFGYGSSDFTQVYGSDDNGATRRHLADVSPAFWGKLFVHRGRLFLLACGRPSGDLVLHASPDGGRAWAEPVVVAAGRFHKAPMPVIAHRGRLWTCVEGTGGAWAAGFGAVALSVPVEADLLNPSNWTVSESLPYDPAWLPAGLSAPKGKHGFLEGNAVADPRGNLLNVLRYHISPNFGKAVVLDIAADGKSLSFNRIADFPGGMTKFTILRHPETGVYWSLVNRVTDASQPGMRNVLTLVSSADLEKWTLVRDLLRDDSEQAPRTTAFQYVDWLFDGPDIIYVSRTACNGAHNFHDANHLTFHRVKDFATGPRNVGP